MKEDKNITKKEAKPEKIMTPEEKEKAKENFMFSSIVWYDTFISNKRRLCCTKY